MRRTFTTEVHATFDANEAVALGLLDRAVEVATRVGELRIEWDGSDSGTVLMTGPVETVFEGSIEL